MDFSSAYYKNKFITTIDISFELGLKFYCETSMLCLKFYVSKILRWNLANVVF